MHLSQISLALTRLSGQFSPASLFAAGEVGAWYDPSDLSTLFDSSAGTTPVTAVEQFVGLMLDKSKGLVLGSELSNFNSASWTKPTGYAVNSSGVTYDGSGSQYSKAALPAVLTAGRSYRFTFTVNAISASSIFVGIGRDLIYLTSYGTTITSPGTYTYLLTAAAGDNCITIQTNNGTQTFSINSLSVRELPGNHAFQTSSTKRPKLAKRYNLLDYTEEFDNGAWTKTNTTVVANAGVAPDGTTTADLLYPTTSGTARYVNRDTTNRTTGESFRTLIRIKAAGINFAYVYNVQGNSLLYVNLTTGATSNVGVNISNLVSSIDGNGWVSVSFNSTLLIGTTASWYVGPCDASGSTQVTANGTDGIYIWGADLRPASQATGLIGPTYQRVAAATVYDTAGFLPYLAFDGLDDSMSTGSIDFATVTSDGQARRNLLSVPTLFNSSPWVVTNVTLASGVADAFGGNNAWTLTASAANGTVSQNTGSLAAGSTISCYIRRRTGTGAVALWVGNAYSNITVTGSWQRVESLQATTTTGYFDIRLSTSGDAVDVMYPQVETGSPATAFQNIGTDKVTVFAGVRKLSDAAPAIISELSANYNVNNGSFLFTVSDPSTSVVAGTLEGVSRNIATFVDAAAPLTEVLSWYIDRALSSNEVVFISKNGVSQSITRTFNDNTTGNFGNYPLYIGARNNASIFFTGWLTSLIVRGAQSTQSQIEATEAWVNGKTGAY